MNWLRLDHLTAADPIVIKGSDGRVAEVQVPCTSTFGTVPVCCPDVTMKRRDKRVIKVRDRRLEPAPTWLHVTVQRWVCPACGRIKKEAFREKVWVFGYDVLSSFPDFSVGESWCFWSQSSVSTRSRWTR